MWYQAIHAAEGDPARCVAAGHVHIGAMVPWAAARLAAEETLRVVIAHVDAILNPPPFGDLNADGMVDAADLGELLAAWGPCPAEGDCPADLDRDGAVVGADLGLLLAAWS